MRLGIGILCAWCMTVLTFPAYAFWDLDLESGYASAGYNNVQVPRGSGSLISLTTDLAAEGAWYQRFRLTRQVGRRDFVSVLYAPLTLRASGTAGAGLFFNGTAFPAGSRLQASYRFDSYRATWYRVWALGQAVSGKLGVTAKIRDAAVQVEDGNQSSEKKNTGFVPLLHFGVTYRLAPAVDLLLDGDAIAGGPGRAEDVLVAVAYRPHDRYALRVGYRAVEGGADVAEVYNFALVNYLVAGVSISF